MKTMSAAEFKTRCLKVKDEVQATRETIIITKRGRPREVGSREKPSRKLFGCLAGQVEIIGDIESPAAWEALR